MGEIAIRTARPNEIDAIFAVHRDAVETQCAGSYAPEEIEHWLDGRSARMYLTAIERGRLWIAADTDHLCGFVEIDGPEVTKLFVRGACAGAGVGSRLLAAAIGAIRAGGANRIIVEATRNARAFYRKRGFLVVGPGVHSHGAGDVAIEVLNMEFVDDAGRAMSDHNKGGLQREDVVAGLRRVGLGSGDVVLVHSALRTLGAVNGGADTVVDALLDVLGPRGTLVAPAFTFVHEVEADPVVDPAADRSEMGAISEAVRQRPDALRSTAFRHSFAAIGRRADVITGVDPALAPYDLRSAFGVMLALDAHVLLLGVTYSNSTSHHFGEWMSEVSYRHPVERHVRVRRVDGTVVGQVMTDYQPRPSADGSYYGTRATDFNHLGRMLEERGLVAIGPVGNAMARRFPMRGLIALAQAEAARDENVFRTPEARKDHVTMLPDGVFVTGDEALDGAGRPERHLWSVVEPERIWGWSPTWTVQRRSVQ